jgi:hypothetical protein
MKVMRIALLPTDHSFVVISFVKSRDLSKFRSLGDFAVKCEVEVIIIALILVMKTA